MPHIAYDLEGRMEILEVGPRDGLQNEPVVLAVADKVELIARAVAAGARRVEAVSFVNPKLVPQMADAAEVMAEVPRQEGVSYSGLVLNPRGLDRALAAGVDEVNVVVVATETFSRRNQNRGVDDMLAAWAQIAGDARAAGARTTVTIAAAFGCPFEGEVAAERVLDIARRAAEAGPYEIALADTIGVGTPDRVRVLLDGLAEAAPGVRRRCHFHNTRNTGYANALTAVALGVDTLDASIGGIGGCPFAPAATGNIATEDLLYALDRMGVPTGLDLASVIAAADWLAGRLGKAVPAQLGRAGVFPATG
ncbi:hydroxymethylglutaryl-CoA lyase [Yinghuangia soli]|uniref:Hydroxymethylglutaryl-CoA lyase n=1 Tax=Yinghuangia soli TaxID=2908204 RepID=A0AA41Q4Q0_9ACTN|nr:hydroxymethylglutaryl-CoA lyase [Yinghuangia soli]MCF2531498.1 hydroxymethylglutaryl-CoA lyase [Yinghuangia soli]